MCLVIDLEIDLEWTVLSIESISHLDLNSQKLRKLKIHFLFGESKELIVQLNRIQFGVSSYNECVCMRTDNEG